jgi:hypothetical protein
MDRVSNSGCYGLPVASEFQPMGWSCCSSTVLSLYVTDMDKQIRCCDIVGLPHLSAAYLSQTLHAMAMCKITPQ